MISENAEIPCASLDDSTSAPTGRLASSPLDWISTENAPRLLHVGHFLKATGAAVAAENVAPKE
jgi:hypothetical protein